MHNGSDVSRRRCRRPLIGMCVNGSVLISSVRDGPRRAHRGRIVGFDRLRMAAAATWRENSQSRVRTQSDLSHPRELDCFLGRQPPTRPTPRVSGPYLSRRTDACQPAGTTSTALRRRSERYPQRWWQPWVIRLRCCSTRVSVAGTDVVKAGRAGCTRGDNRARLHVGSRRGWPGQRRQRARGAAQRDGLRAARTRPVPSGGVERPDVIVPTGFAEPSAPPTWATSPAATTIQASKSHTG